MGLIEYEKLSQLRRAPVSEPTTLPVVEEVDAPAEVAVSYAEFRSHFGRPEVPGLLKCFATHPPLLHHMLELSKGLIFSDGHLGRRHKEMIATLVSTQNECAYCADSHGYFLRVHGGSAEMVSAIAGNDLDSSALSAAEQALLRFAEKVNRSSQEIGQEDVLALTGVGWSELQIAEAVHITALFATFNRVANAFGLRSQGLLALYEG